MSNSNMSQTSSLYQPQQFQQLQKKPDLESINELSRSSTGSTQYSHSSDIYHDNEQEIKIELNFTKEEVELVTSTWKVMISDDLNKSLNDKSSSTYTSIASSLFCIQFYSNLLAMDSNLEKMFPSIKHQAISFAGVLSTAIINLETLEVLDDYLMNLGKRHARILGIDPPHFELMGVALLKTFRDRFGPVGFTLELERCWARLYTYLANSILQFGIDPVLRNDKINNDVVFRRTSTVQPVPSQLELQKAALTPAGRNSSVSSASSATTLVNSPSQGIPKVGSVSSSTSKFAKRASKMSNRITSSSTAGQGEQDEKCTIM